MRLQPRRPATISKLYAELAKSGGKGSWPLAVPTVQHVHRSLRKALNDAVMIEAAMTANPTLKAKLPREGYREPRVVWTPEDLEVFMGEAARHRLHGFFRLAAYTGGRRGEILHLRWADVDLDAAEIRFEGSTGVVDGKRIDGSTKRGRSRVVGVDQGTMQVLEKVAAQAVQRSAFPDAYPKWQRVAEQVVADPIVLSAVCTGGAGFISDGSQGAGVFAAALRYLGTPYSWGGGGPNGPSPGFGSGANTIGFDCSSLVQYAWQQGAGLALPRVTDAQAAATMNLPPGAPLRAGDLLFFHDQADPPGSYHHMGIYDGNGNMVHAPRTGKTVEVVHDVFSDPYYAAQFASHAPRLPLAHSTSGGATRPTSRTARGHRGRQAESSCGNGLAARQPV